VRLKPRLRGRFAPGDRLCGRRGSVHAGGRPAKSLPEAISIAELSSGVRLKPRLRGRFAPGDRLCGRRGSVHEGGRPAKSLPEAISIAERQVAEELRTLNVERGSVERSTLKVER